MTIDPSLRPRKSGTPAGMKEALKKATAEMLILILLRQQPMYVYELMQNLKLHSKGVLTFNSLYLAIYRLKDHDYVTEAERLVTGDNRVRIYFAVTAKGNDYLNQLLSEYLVTVSAIDKIIALDPSLTYKGNADDYGERSDRTANIVKKVFESTEEVPELSSTRKRSIFKSRRGYDK